MLGFATLLLAAAATIALDQVPSPSRELFAHYTLCSQSNRCIPEIVITGQNGEERRRFAVRADQGSCASILLVEWADEKTIGAECHANPSMSYYYELDVESGRVLREYTGNGFSRSPDGGRVAHVGWVAHFAPPQLRSDYLQVGDTLIYPLPEKAKPWRPKGPMESTTVVIARDSVFADVHQFQSKFVWSSDSRKIGFVDCLVDYRLRDSSQEAFYEGGKPENTRCFLVAVDLDGVVRRAPLPRVTYVKSGLQWTDPATLSINHGGIVAQVKLQ